MIPGTITRSQYIGAIGIISGELAHRSGAWEGKAPEWFPQPPEWLKLAENAVEQMQEQEATSV